MRAEADRSGTFQGKIFSAIGKIRPFCILAGLAAGAWVLVDPRGDFPLNDDWAYAGCVRHFVEEGRFVLSDWSSPLAFPHYISGIVFAKIFGFNRAVLRLSTLFWSVTGVCFLHKILEQRGVRTGPRWLACGLLFFNPLYFVLSFTYHTDVPFLSLALMSIYFFQRADAAGQTRDEWIASFLALTASLTRQIGLAIPFAATIWFLHKRQFHWGRGLRIWTPPALGMAVFYYWFLHMHGPTWAHVNYVTQGTWKYATAFGPFARETARRATDSLLYASLFCASFLFFPKEKKPPRNFARDIVFLALGAALAFYVSNRGLFPYLENVFHPRGLGTMTIYEGNKWKPALLWDRKWLWSAYTGGSALALWLFLYRHARKPFGLQSQTPFLFAAGPALATLAGARYFDRYTLEWVAALILFMSIRHGQTRVPRSAWALLGFWALLSLAGTRDYFTWNRAKWEFGKEAAALGYAPREIANGFDWNAHWKYESNMAELKRRKTLEEIKEWEWETMEPVRGVITYSPGMLSRDHLKLRKTYFSVLSPRGATLYFFGKDKSNAS